MKIVFVSNILNHHSLPLCTSLIELADDFKFVATVDSQSEGYQRIIDADFVIKAYDENEKYIAEEFVLDADIAIFGSNSDELLKKRMALNKISFLYSERFFKKGFWQKYNPKTRKKLNEKLLTYKDKKLYILCASAYLPTDLETIGFPTTKCYKWGYFPLVVERIESSPQKEDLEKIAVKLIWVGRFLEWKHPEYVVCLANKLKIENYKFNIEIVGNGPMHSKLEYYVKKHGLNDVVRFLGSKKPEEVFEYINDADIFLFTSDFKEGWGAVLNEGMGVGCACVASHAAGSTAFLVKDGENGLIFQSGNFNSFYKKVRQLIDDDVLRNKMSKSAFDSINNDWNAQIAAKRLLLLYNNLMQGKDTPYQDGPCSKAEVLKHNWYKG